MDFPHDVFTKKVSKDGSLVVVKNVESGCPVIDPLLRADWTDVDNMLSNNVDILPITTYLTSSLEVKSRYLGDTLAYIDSQIEPTSESTPVSSPESTPVSTPVSTPESTPEPTV